MQFKTNESTVDRLIRIAVGVALAALALSGAVAAPWLYIVWLVAAIAIVTGVVGFCAIYALLGLSTRRTAD